ncbi:sulfatase [Rhizobium sp. Leaf311]|uniref:sulfatase n=1 Tax=Rhizobium sp. Leaf311 TaxID=1736332 RepID=UPI000B34018D|nr:sulfatase [Rhizobium sp. Leaf311]
MSSTIRAGWDHITLKALIGALLFSATAFVAFTLPDHPDTLSASNFARLPLEWSLIALLVLISRGWLRRTIVFVSGFIVFLVLLLKVADIGVQSAFQRQFNPYLDLKMLTDGWNLISGTIGNAAAVVALICGALLILLVAALFLKSLKWMTQAPQGMRHLLAGIFALVTVASGCLLLLGAPQVTFATPTYLSSRLDLIVRSVADMRVFEKELAKGIGPQNGRNLFKAVKGKDIYVIFVESYGRSAVEDPQYKDVTSPRLAAIEKQIQAVGLQSASGWITSPTVGGLSWLAHGTLLSGLWVDSQARYDRLMISRQPSLNRLFSEAGWHSVAVMPAITMAWPEANYFGYDQILAASDLDYRGKPFNWVTMPDQYTLSALDRLAIKPAHERGQNVMAEIALISSHAPWTPVPRLIDWNEVGDGSAFNEQATSGDPPSVVWANPDRVRRQYTQTIDYSLATLGDFMARQGRGAIYIIIGDHQPASIITGPGASRAVPVHIVADDAKLLAPFLEAGFTDGMTVSGARGEPRMDELRSLLLGAFGGM